MRTMGWEGEVELMGKESPAMQLNCSVVVVVVVVAAKE